MAFRYLSQGDRTVAQVTGYLQRRSLPERAVRKAVERCIELGYLNDRAFALRWAESRLARRPMAWVALEAELLAKGFDEPLVAETLTRLYGRGTERRLASLVMQEQKARGRAGSQARLASVLRQRGFNEDLIVEALGAERLPNKDVDGD
ncbi:MAG: regulatory protein RecX [Nitrospiraceae bacterium]